MLFLYTQRRATRAGMRSADIRGGAQFVLMYNINIAILNDGHRLQRIGLTYILNDFNSSYVFDLYTGI